MSAQSLFKLFGLFGIIYFAFHLPAIIDAYLNSPEHLAEVKAEEAKEAECDKPRTELVTQKDDVKLYVYKSYCHTERPVYFSASGTTTTHDERRGKSYDTVTDVVPNTYIGACRPDHWRCK
jgi:hypothetical protein